MTAFDVVLRGGLVVDGTGAPGRLADVGVMGDRILAIGDLSALDAGEVALTIDAAGLVVAPGFIDPHGHSDGSLFLDGGLVSHLRQGFTTQLSGNCGESLAPITDMGRELVALSLRPHYGSTARVLGTYVRERGGVAPDLSLETAVAKMTSVPAARLGLRDRGVLRECAMADLVAFDPMTVADIATYADPARHPVGIQHVVVNGWLTVHDGAETGERAGRLLRQAG
ncbi:MAG: amidohydrolase family protein [Candidatus Limnocylindrales bacterium]